MLYGPSSDTIMKQGADHFPAVGKLYQCRQLFALTGSANQIHECRQAAVSRKDAGGYSCQAARCELYLWRGAVVVLRASRSLLARLPRISCQHRRGKRIVCPPICILRGVPTTRAILCHLHCCVNQSISVYLNFGIFNAVIA